MPRANREKPARGVARRRRCKALCLSHVEYLARGVHAVGVFFLLEPSGGCLGVCLSPHRGLVLARLTALLPPHV